MRYTRALLVAALAIALAERVALRHPEQAAASLEQVSTTSSFAQLALIRLRLRRGQRDQAREAALRAMAEARLVCGLCRCNVMPGFIPQPGGSSSMCTKLCDGG